MTNELFETLNAPLRLSLSLTVLAFVWRARGALVRAGVPGVARPVTVISALLFAVAALFAHTPLAALTSRVFPVGLAAGLVAAGAGLVHGPTRRAFDAIDDRDARVLLGYRATFGAFLFAAAGLAIVPPAFALVAGVGDLAVGWAASVVPGSLGAGGNRRWRLLVHGLGLIDLVLVLSMVVTVVLPWSAAHGGVAPTATLPWVAVPLMLALNLHGLRQALREQRAAGGGRDEAGRDALAGGDRSEPAGGVRGALRGA